MKEALIRVCTLFSFTMCICSCGVREEDQQSTVEANALAHLQRDLKSYENNHPGVPITNMLQLFLNTTNSPWGYPHALEAKLRTFGQNAGFTNSIYEKYVIVPPGISNQTLGGQLVLICARPSPDRNKTLTRKLILRKGQNYIADSLPEPHIQQILAATGFQVPAPSAMPKPPPTSPADARVFGENDLASRTAVSTRVKNSLDQFGQDMGIGPGHWMTITFSLGVLILLGIVTVIFFVRRAGRE